MNNQNIEEILKNLANETVSQDVHRIAEETSAKFTKTLLPSRQRILWSNIMKTRTTKLATAAVIVIAAALSITVLDKSAAPAWADTLERIYEATSVTYKKTFEGDKMKHFYFEVMVNEKGMQRSHIGGQIMIYDFSTNKSLMLIPSRKEAVLTHRVGGRRIVKPFNELEFLTSIKDKAGEFLGTEDINGTLANKFFWQWSEYRNVTVWVDPSTELPLKVKQVHLPNPDESIIPPHFELSLGDFGGTDGQIVSMSGTGEPGIQKKMIIIMKDFIWNQQLDPALFSTEPPKDYTLREKQHDVSDLGENGLIQALAFWTEMSGGSFPTKINDLVDPNQINPMLIEKFDGDGDPSDEIDEAMKQASIIAKGLFFAQGKKAEQNWHYEGDGVCLGDSDTMVCWWKQEDTNDYRVIFGDLSIGTVSAEQLPE